MLPILTKLSTTLAALALLATAAHAQLPGRIYLTDATGTPRNHFPAGSPVFLAGGPALDSGTPGAGLRDGVYVFQVTDLAGTTLLSTDSIASRIVLVTGGAIRGVMPGGHPVVRGPSGTVLVQLQPYAENSATSGERVVWMTPASAYQPGEAIFGFHPSVSLAGHYIRLNHDWQAVPLVIAGQVYWDFDEDGVFEPSDPNEVPLAGWKVRLTSNGVPSETYTDANGFYEFHPAPGSTNRVQSIAPEPGFIPNPGGRWLATNPAVVLVPNPPPAGPNVAIVDFGNLYFENNPGTARSIGYWHNQGRAVLEACDPEWRLALNRFCLRTNLTSPPNTEAQTMFAVPETGNFDSAYRVLSNYLVAPAHGVLAYQLSRQFAAANLNVSCGPLQNLPTFVDRFENDILVDLDFMVDQTSALLCLPCAGNSGRHGDQDCRAMIMGCLSEWEGLNSSGSRTYTRSGSPPAIFY
jgi:hypothetical protein